MLESKTIYLRHYPYKRDQYGSLHRVIKNSTYRRLLNFYSSHIYLNDKWVDKRILDSSDSRLNHLKQCALNKEEQRLKKLENLGLSPNHDLRLLELGCGCASFLYLWEHKHFGVAQGIDISNLAVEVSERLWDKEMSNVHIYTEEITKELKVMAENSSKPYDVIVAFDIIEHVIDSVPVIQLIYTLLKPDGWCVVEVPIISSHWSHPRLTEFELLYPRRHLHLFTSSGILKLFGEAKFTPLLSKLTRGGTKRLIVFRR